MSMNVFEKEVALLNWFAALHQKEKSLHQMSMAFFDKAGCRVEWHS